MPANEASGIGGRSYGRVALYLQEVSLARFVLHYNNSIRLETLRFFLVKIKIVAIIREVKNSSRCLLRNRISSKPKHKKDGKKKKATIENRLRPETHVCVCVFLFVLFCCTCDRPAFILLDFHAHHFLWQGFWSRFPCLAIYKLYRAGGDGVVQVAVANEAPLDSTRKTYLPR